MTETNSTRQKLQNALIELMKDRPYREISVSELCRKAGVSRMGFYRNYAVINDLFRETANHLNDVLVEAIGSPFRKKTTKEWYAEAFRMMLDESEALSVMFQENFQFEWMQVVNSIAIHEDNFPTEKIYQRLMWVGGFENVLGAWLKSGMKESPEEMAEYCIKYLPHLLEADK